MAIACRTSATDAVASAATRKLRSPFERNGRSLGAAHRSNSFRCITVPSGLMSCMALSPVRHAGRMAVSRKPNVVSNVRPTQIQQLQALDDSAGLRVRLLGPMAVTSHGMPIGIASKKSRALLAYLVLRDGAEISRNVLTGLLWGERSEGQARASLRQGLSELRAALAGSDPQPIVADREAVTWRPELSVGRRDRAGFRGQLHG